MIREATRHDRPAFLQLWQEYQKEQREHGSHVHDSLANLMIHRDLFDAYVTGSLFGFCLFWTPNKMTEPQACVMAGEPWGESRWETDLGKTATLWGVYVHPEHRGGGIGLKLERAALPVGLNMGFKTVETFVLVGNPHGERIALGFGTEPRMAWHTADLQQVADSLEDT